MSLSHLKKLESEAIHVFREVVAEFENPVMLYSVGKDSSVMVRLAQKAFYPGKIPFPLLHVDTGYKFPEMYAFRDKFIEEENLDLIVYRNEEAISAGVNPFDKGPSACCAELKTKALLDALNKGNYDAAFGGARRDEEKSRAKERIFSFRDAHGQWDPKNQRPELWNLYNCRVHQGESIRVFPISNWTELDVWQYILMEKIPIVPMYFAKDREVYETNGQLIHAEEEIPGMGSGEKKNILCRFRSLGCIPCSGAVHSSARDVAEIIEEVFTVKTSERNTRMIDHDKEGSMEQKKREGYF